MRIQNVLGSSPFVRLGMRLSRIIPAGPMYALSRFIGWLGLKRRNNLFCAIRGNLEQVLGPDTDPEELDQLARDAIVHTGHTYFDMFRTDSYDYVKGLVPIRIDPDDWSRVREAFESPRGTVVVGPHTSNFDLAAQWFVAQGFEMQALSLSDPNKGTLTVNRLREERGLMMTPIDQGSLRQAIKRLRTGGIVITGVDRPVSPDDEPLPFFGAPARLPTGHVRLALQTKTPIIIAACTQDDDGVYRIHLAGPLEMEISGDRAADTRHNAIRVLQILEGIIRQHPSQWLMFWPVWSDD